MRELNTTDPYNLNVSTHYVGHLQYSKGKAKLMVKY